MLQGVADPKALGQPWHDALVRVGIAVRFSPRPRTCPGDVTDQARPRREAPRRAPLVG